jgi:TPR repeat protein
MISLLLLASLASPSRDFPAVQAPPDEVRELFGLTGFYDQWLEAGGLPIVASHRVHPVALQEARFLILQMLGHRPEVLAAMATNGVRYTVMAFDEWTTDVPEHADLEPARYWDRRARGLGATRHRPSVSCGEENLLGYPGDPYATENILIHEFAHAIHEMGLSSTDPTFDPRLLDAYNEALREGRWKGTYAETNRMEYWAEGVQSYFDTNRENDDQHGAVDTREELAEHDPPLFALCVEVFGAEAWRYVHARERLDQPHLAGYEPADAPRFAWPAPMVEAYREEESERALRRRAGETGPEYDQRVAEAGGARAMLRLGVGLRDGRGVEQDHGRALEWMERAAATGYPPAWDHLGWMREHGLGCERDEGAAVALYRRAAEARHAQARFNLGRMLRDGRGVPEPDPVLAAMWFELAAMVKHHAATEALQALELSEDQRARAQRLAKAWH